MVIHHVYGFPQWLLNNDDSLTGYFLGFPLYEWVQYSTELCVEIFAFMTGWSYFFAKDKDYKYSFIKLKDFFKTYWIHLFFFIIIALLSGYNFTFIDFLKSLIAINNPNIILFGWYVNVYLFIMLTLPLLVKLINKSLVFTMIALFILHILSYFITGVLGTLIHNYTYYVFIVISGYICSHFNILGRINLNKNKVLNIIFLIILLFISGYLRFIFPLKLYIILLPFIILNFNNCLKNSRLQKYYEFLGIHSLNIWFNHALFFSYYTRDHFQHLIYDFKNPILVILFTIFLGIIMSKLVNLIKKNFNLNSI